MVQWSYLMRKLRVFLIRLLAGDMTVVMNATILGNLAANEAGMALGKMHLFPTKNASDDKLDTEANYSEGWPS
jgi:hypothetical protein